MNQISDEDRALAQGVERCTATGSDFNHAAHVQLARFYLVQHGFEEGALRFERALKGFAAHLGVPGKFHATITRAFLVLIDDGLQKSPRDEGWNGFRARQRAMLDGGSSLLSTYYTTRRLNSSKARSEFMQPDLRPLPGL